MRALIHRARVLSDAALRLITDLQRRIADWERLRAAPAARVIARPCAACCSTVLTGMHGCAAIADRRIGQTLDRLDAGSHLGLRTSPAAEAVARLGPARGNEVPGLWI
jgi:hypothetical protein